MERLSLIDVAAEDDFLASSPCDSFIDQISPGISENHAANKSQSLQSATVASEESGGQIKTSKVTGQTLKLAESPEKNQTKSGKCNLRKSLAWDNAFFTSEGVLDNEELAVMNSTFKKTEACSLPVIMEDMRKSSESTSTLDNDSWPPETLQIDSFENIRASIKKTHGIPGKALKLADPTKKIIPGSIKVEPSSRNKKNYPGLTSHHHEHTRRGAAVAVNTATKTTDRITSSKILSKPARVLPRATPAVPTKASLVPRNTQIRASAAELPVTQKSGGVSKKTSKGSSGATPKSSQFPKGLKPTPNIANNSADKANKSPQHITRLKNTSTTMIRASSRSIMNKASTRASVTNIACKNKSSPAMSPGSFANSSTISPSSSFDSIVSASSSSTLHAVISTADCIDGSSSFSFLEGTEDDRRDYSCRLDATKSSPNSRAQIEPSRENNLEGRSTISAGAKCHRPSGLKLPTPKIGYFDAKKSPVCNVKTSQTRQQLIFPRSTAGVSTTDLASKLKLSNSQQFGFSSDSPKTQSAALSGIPSAEPISQKQPVASNDLTCTTKTHSEMHPTGISELPKPSTKVQDGDLHPKHVVTFPVEVEATVLIDNGSSPIRKQVEMGYCGKETDCQKTHHCDLSTINMDKENILPAE